jgi:hypothetical protein
VTGIPKENLQETVQRDVLATLNTLSGPSDVLPLSRLSEDTEAALLEILIGIAKRQLLFKKRKQQIADLENDVVVIGTSTFQIATHAASSSAGEPPDSLCLQVLPMWEEPGLKPKPALIASSKVCGLGRYRFITVSVPKSFAGEGEKIAEAAVCALETGYAWLAEKASTIISQIQDAAVDGLYAHTRTVLPNYEHQIFLFLFRENKGIYVHDIQTARAWMRRAGERRVHSTYSPIELFTQLATAQIKFDESFSRVVHGDQSIRNFPLVLAPYSHTGLQVAEMAIYEGDKFICHPLVTEQKVVLTAGYPTHVRSAVEKTLTREKPRFREILIHAQSDLKRMHRTVEALRLAGRSGDRITELAGIFTGAAAGAYQRIKGE